MWVVRLVALVLLGAGVLVAAIGSGFIGGSLETVTLRAPISSLRFTPTKKLGHTLTLELEGHPDVYSRNHLQKVEGLEDRLKNVLRVGTIVQLESVERPSAGEYASPSVPLAILKLFHESELLFDNRTFERHGWINWLVPAIGGLIAAAGAAILFATFRKAAAQ